MVALTANKLPKQCFGKENEQAVVCTFADTNSADYKVICFICN